MVRGGGQGAHTVVASGETTGDDSLEEALSVTGVVDTLEESELRSVEGLSWVQAVSEILNCNVCVPNNLSSLQKLRRGVVRGICVREGTSDKVGHLNGNVEGGIRFNVLASCRGECDHGRNHCRLRGNVTHCCCQLVFIHFNM